MARLVVADASALIAFAAADLLAVLQRMAAHSYRIAADLLARALIMVPATSTPDHRRSAQRTLRINGLCRVRCADRTPLAGTTIEALARIRSEYGVAPSEP